MAKADQRRNAEHHARPSGLSHDRSHGTRPAVTVGLGLVVVVALASAPSFAQQPTGDPSSGTELTMRPVTVKDQHQLRGRFGDKWQADEVKARAAATCASAGMRLVYFKAQDPDAKGRSEFAAVCR